MRTPIDLQLVMQLSCAATSNRVARDPAVPNPESIGDMILSYSTSRYDHTGVRVSTGPARVFDCPESGVVDIALDINLAEPAVAGTTDNIVIRVRAEQQINTPGTNGFVEGSTFIENRMSGFIEVRPGG